MDCTPFRDKGMYIIIYNIQNLCELVNACLAFTYDANAEDSVITFRLDKACVTAARGVGTSRHFIAKTTL